MKYLGRGVRIVFCLPILLLPVAADPVEVPGGTFPIGSDVVELEQTFPGFGLRLKAMLLAETPRHSVTVRPFRMDPTEVTNRNFLRFVRSRPEWADQSPKAPDGYLRHWVRGEPPSGQEDHPVTNITWQAAAAYCEWSGGRLPSEPEWEVAARGGRPDAVYPWGSELPGPDLANYSASGIQTTQPVGRYGPNGYGLHDMAGNVWEFTADPWRDRYSDPAPRDPVDFHKVQSRRVIRGGSYGAAAFQLRVTARDSHPPQNPVPHVGFRCVR